MIRNENIFFVSLQFENSFNLNSLTTSGQWTLLWNNLLDILKTPTKVQFKCLQVIRILSRDKTYLNETINDDQFDCLLESASIGSENKVQQPTEIQIESLKILCNLVFQSKKCQELCLKNSAVEGILKRLRTYKDHHVDYEVKLYDMRLLFLITALTPNVRTKVRDDYHGLVYLVETLDLAMKNSSSSSKVFDQQEMNLIIEILKVLCNLIARSPTTVETEEDDEQHLHRLSIVLHDLLLFGGKTFDESEEYYLKIINLLVYIPVACFIELVPQTNDSSAENETYEYFSVHSINIFLNLLKLRLKKICEGRPEAEDYEQLSPILIVLIKSIRCTSVIRRYVRSQILPPLCDVKKRPEEGTTVRNHLCKLLTYPSTQISDLVAELLFVLCKENVGRMIKYTGYGNAAGLFAKRGLLGGRNSENQQQYSSDSEDSDTDEYKELQHGINPVIGCYEPPKRSPLEGMSEEQVRIVSILTFIS